MAWGGTTTEIDTHYVDYESVKIVSTNLLASTVGSTNLAHYQLPGGLKLTSGSDIVRIPFHKPNGKMLIYGQIYGAELAYYPGIAIRLPESSDGLAWRSPYDAGSSTEESGWKMILSTATLVGSSGREGFIAGPFETAKYGRNFFGTSSASIDLNQSFLEVAFICSSVASTGTFLTASTFTPSTQNCPVSIIAFELP